MHSQGETRDRTSVWYQGSSQAFHDKELSWGQTPPASILIDCTFLYLTAHRQRGAGWHS